jgi:hypothetical protein
VRVFKTLDLKPRIYVCTLSYGFGNRILIKGTLYLFMGLSQNVVSPIISIRDNTNACILYTIGYNT